MYHECLGFVNRNPLLVRPTTLHVLLFTMSSSLHAGTGLSLNKTINCSKVPQHFQDLSSCRLPPISSLFHSFEFPINSRSHPNIYICLLRQKQIPQLSQYCVNILRRPMMLESLCTSVERCKAEQGEQSLPTIGFLSIAF